MVTDEELDKLSKIKVLLKGNSGTGKTFASVKVTDYVASKGFEVLYLDNESGATKEIRKLGPEAKKNIHYRQFENFQELTEKIAEFKGRSEDIKLMVIDPMHLVEICRISAKNAFFKEGSYYIGEKKVAITNKDTFDLRGYMYQVPNSWIFEFLNGIANAKQDVICTLMTPNKYDVERPYDGKFDYVFETFTEFDNNDKIIFRASPKKLRGAESQDTRAITNIGNLLISIFKMKYEKKPEGVTEINQKPGEVKQKPDEVKQNDNTISTSNAK